MEEARKTERIRGEGFKHTYLTGTVIDIGCGSALVVPHAVPFDVEHGDAQRLLDYFEPRSFDCVHSSHCLEHMKNGPEALRQWWALVKPGGYLVLVVPDEDLYEQGAWPSIFSNEHFSTFNLGKRASWSPVSLDIAALVSGLPGAELLDACVQDDGYDRRLMRQRISRLGRLLFKLAPSRRELFRRLMSRGLPCTSWTERSIALKGRLASPSIKRSARL